MADYHLQTFVTDKDAKEVSPGGKRKSDAQMVGTLMSKRRMFHEGLEKGEESAYAAGNEHGGSRRIYFAQKAQKQKQMQSDHQMQSEIFKGCRIFNNSGRSPHELKRVLEENGGRVIFTRDTEQWTHYVTNELTDSAKRQETSKKLKEKHAFLTVTEAWIYDSVNQGRRLNEADYSPYGRVAANIGQFLPSGHTNPLKRASASKSGALSSVGAPSSSTASRAPQDRDRDRDRDRERAGCNIRQDDRMILSLNRMI